MAAMVLLAVVAGGFWYWHAQKEAAKPSSAIQAIMDELRQAPPEQPVPPVTPPPKHGLPRVAIVIDDVGMNDAETQKAINLPPGVTLSFFPYAPHVQESANAAHAAGHEVFLHLPMEAVGGEDPGPGALRVKMSDDEIRQNLEHDLNSFHGYTGINNHMGSRFTADERGMRFVMESVKARGLIFLDSRTTVLTKGEDLAREMGVPTIRRHIFLDNTLTEESIAEQFSALLKLAANQGEAVAIAHPHEISLEFLAHILPYLRGRYELVPVSALVSKP